MAIRPPRPCVVHGCPNLVRQGSRCEKHRLPRPRDGRPNAAQRGYGYAHRRKRDELLRRHPWCADPFGLHAGRLVKATVRDHIVPLNRGGRDDIHNEQPLCDRCHNYKMWRDGSKGRGG